MTPQNAAPSLREKADKYTEFVSRGFGKDLAKRLGLPQPGILRRYSPQAPLVEGPILVLGQGAGADGVAKVLLDWHQDVRRHATPKEKLGAIVAVLDELEHPEQLSATMLTIGAALRDLNKNARVVTISRPRWPPMPLRSQRRATELMGSCAPSPRNCGPKPQPMASSWRTESPRSPSAVSTLRFFLSGRSAFVDGQFLTASTEGLSEQPDWAKPLKGSVAVVTGAARGIGAAIARTLARDGATVIAVDVPAAGDHLAAVANEIRGTALQLDITNVDAGQRILEHAVALRPPRHCCPQRGNHPG